MVKEIHKHSYIALSGVGVVIGAHTGKVIGIGVRNKFCSTCQTAEHLEKTPPPHTCYKNWDESSAAIEPDIMVELFLDGEKQHGLLYLKVVRDGDSSVLHKLLKSFPPQSIRPVGYI